MTMYATKVWGFASADWPVITFSREGVRNRLASLWQPGDTMLLIGTQGEPTKEEDKGRILGYIEFTAAPVVTREVVNPELLAITGDKWPYALLCLQMWRINNPPLFKDALPDVYARCPGMTLATNYTVLTEAEEALIRQLPFTHETLPLNEIGKRAADATDMVGWLRRRGPKPSTGSYVGNKESRSAKTYLLGWKTKGLMKVGWAYDPNERAKSLSQPLVPVLTGEQWDILQVHSWPSEVEAQIMEQEVLNKLEAREIKIYGEYFQPPKKTSVVTIEIWREALEEAFKKVKAMEEHASNKNTAC